MVVRGLLRNISSQLGDLDLSDEVPLEAPKEHFALTRLEAISDRGDRPYIVRHGEEDELLIYKVRYRKGIDVMIEESTGLASAESRFSSHLELSEPLFSVISLLFVECHVDESPVFGLHRLKR